MLFGAAVYVRTANQASIHATASGSAAIEEGLTVFGVDASRTLIAAYQLTTKHACEREQITASVIQIRAGDRPELIVLSVRGRQAMARLQARWHLAVKTTG
jgi:hypothetical protein